MRDVDARLKRIEGSIPAEHSGPCHVCAGYPRAIPIYYRDDGGEQLYTDSELSTPAQTLWPCPACGHCPHKVTAIVVDYIHTSSADVA